MNRRALLRSTTGLIVAASFGGLAFAQSGADSHRMTVDPAALFSRSFPRIVAEHGEFSAEDIAAVGSEDMYGEPARAAQFDGMWKHMQTAFAPGSGPAYVERAAAATLGNPEGIAQCVALMKATSRREAKAPAAALLRSQDARFAVEMMAPIAVLLVAFGLPAEKAADLINSEMGGAVTVQFGAGYAAGMPAQASATRSGNGFAIRLEPAPGQGGSDPVPGPSTQGFWGRLWDFVSGVANFYLDLLWNMFMGAAAGAGIGAAIGWNPFAAAMGGAVGAAAGAWYTVGKLVFGGGGGVWLGPDPQNPDPICSNPIIRC